MSLNLYKPNEWAKRMAERHPLARSIMKELSTDADWRSDELERVAEIRMVAGSHAG